MEVDPGDVAREASRDLAAHRHDLCRSKEPWNALPRPSARGCQRRRDLRGRRRRHVTVRLPTCQRSPSLPLLRWRDQTCAWVDSRLRADQAPGRLRPAAGEPGAMHGLVRLGAMWRRFPREGHGLRSADQDARGGRVLVGGRGHGPPPSKVGPTGSSMLGAGLAAPLPLSSPQPIRVAASPCPLLVESAWHHEWFLGAQGVVHIRTPDGGRLRSAARERLGRSPSSIRPLPTAIPPLPGRHRRSRAPEPRSPGRDVASSSAQPNSTSARSMPLALVSPDLGSTPTTTMESRGRCRNDPRGPAMG